MWDKIIIAYVQEVFRSVPLICAILPDSSLYAGMIVLPIALLYLYLYSKMMSKKIPSLKVLAETALIASIPLFSFLLNLIIKNVVQRQRPPYEFQQFIHPNSYSFVSSHSLVTFSLYGFIIFLVLKYCKNIVLKITLVTISALWIITVGWSRIFLGVHYPSDVLSAYLLGVIILLIYIKIYEKLIKELTYEKCTGNSQL